MSLKDLKLEKTYDSADIDINKEFYEKVLKESICYDRLTGFFSSNSFGICPEGLISFINNGGKIRIITSPRLNSEDIEILKQHKKSLIEIVENKLLEQINIVEEIKNNNLFAFGWLLKTGKLEIKIALVKDDNNEYLPDGKIEENQIFHIKTGILKDKNNNVISFSGSINETYFGWEKNIEAFKVFKGWEEVEKEYCYKDLKDFNSYWMNIKPNVEVLNLPEVVFKKMIKYSANDCNDLIKRLRNKEKDKEKLIEQINLFPYQAKAMQNWFQNDKKGLIEMATGTGKTRVALACLEKILEQEKKLIVVIATPQNSLSIQWKTEVENLNLKIDNIVVADGNNINKYKDLYKISGQISVFEGNLVIFTTHETSSSKKFIEYINSINEKNIKLMFIGDETHKLGARQLSKALLDKYNYRIGLSATPNRWYDEYGTKKIIDFYGKTVFEFSIEDALTKENPITGKPYLVNYFYKPIFVDLEEDEKKEYLRITKKILTILSNKNLSEDERQSCIEKLSMFRANIHKNANLKYQAFKELLSDNLDIKDSITFVSPEQKDIVKEIFNEFGIPIHQFTENEDTKPLSKYNGLSERDNILKQFKDGKYKSLIAITCLNEGIDIPKARIAIILSSSTNPREYIQRIGRVIRQCEGKTNAIIYDFIVRPVKSENPELNKIEEKIYEKELIRVKEIASNAINSGEIIRLI